MYQSGIGGWLASLWPVCDSAVYAAVLLTGLSSQVTVHGRWWQTRPYALSIIINSPTGLYCLDIRRIYCANERKQQLARATFFSILPLYRGTTSIIPSILQHGCQGFTYCGFLAFLLLWSRILGRQFQQSSFSLQDCLNFFFFFPRTRLWFRPNAIRMFDVDPRATQLQCPSFLPRPRLCFRCSMVYGPTVPSHETHLQVCLGF